MPKKKQSVNAYGRSWSPVDLPNLEKAIKLYERLNYLQDHFAGSLSGAASIWSQINEKTDIQNELQAMGIKLTKEQAEKVYQLVRNIQLEQSTRAEIVSSEQAIISANDKYKNGRDNATSWSNAGSRIASVMQQRDANRIQTSAYKELAKNYIQNNKSIQSDDFANTLNKTVSTRIEASASKYSKAANVLQIAVNTFKSGVDTWVNIAKQGLQNQTNAYENTFEGISVRTGITRSQYYGMQSSTNNLLSETSLRNNIRTSDIQQVWSTLTTQGINIDENREQYIANAIDTVLTNKIVPYLNTSDAYYQQLIAIQPTLNKQIRGINLAANELLGSSVVITDHLQDLITNMSPMAALAEQELGVQYAKTLGVYEAMRADGLSDYTIGQMLHSVESVYRNPYEALTSSSLDKNLAAVNAITGGGDLSDLSYMNQSYLTGLNTINGLLPSNRLTSLFVDATNLSSIGTMAQTELIRGKYNVTDYFGIAENYANNLDKYANIATSNYKNDINQTNTTLQNITLENLMNELAVINEWMGNWAGVITTAIKGVGTLIGGFLAGKLIGGLAGGSSFLSGIGSGIVAGANTLGANLAVSGSAIVGNGASTGLALGVGAAGATAGIGMAAYGGTQAYKNFKEGETGAGVANTIGAIGGAVGTGLLLASNPIGWAALAVGGIGLAVGKLADYTENFIQNEENIAEASKIVTQKWDNVGKQLAEEVSTREDTLYTIKEKLEDNVDVEVMRKQLISTGILAEEDVAKARTANIDGLISLTDAYLEATKQFGDKGQEILDKYKQKESDSYGRNAMDLSEWWEENKNYQKGNANYDQMKLLVDTVYNDLITREDLTEDQQKLVEKYIEYEEDGYTRHELENIIDVFENGKQFNNLLSESAMKKLSRSKFASDYGISDYVDYDDNIVTMLAAAMSSGNKNTALDYLKQLKEMGYTSETDNTYKDDIASIMAEYGIEPGSYRTGLSFVPYDNYLANLHEGEAVLTASTANELRNLVVEYRETNTQSINFEAIIQTQTLDLVSKLDEVISAIRGNQISSFSSNKGDSSRLDNMLSFTSSKSFM